MESLAKLGLAACLTSSALLCAGASAGTPGFSYCSLTETGEKNKVVFTAVFEQESGKQEEDAPVFAKNVTSLLTFFDKSKAIPKCFWGSDSAKVTEELEKTIADARKGEARVMFGWGWKPEKKLNM